jgi:hypothetical protein
MTASGKWRISSHSGQNNSCVELAVHSDRTRIRDSKSRVTGTLALGAREWSMFLSTVKHGALDD